MKGDFLLETGSGNDVLMVGAMGPALNVVFVVVFIEEARQRTYIDPLSGEERVETYVETYTVVQPVLEQVDRDAGPVKFCKPARVRFGPGDDVLNLATDAIVTFQRKASFNGQNGSNSSNVGLGHVLGSPSLKHLPNAT